MEDLISRQAAIAEIARWIGYLDEDMINRIQIGLKRLPSAQPETHDKRTETHSCDCIDRQAVLKAINNMVKECDSVYVTSALRNLEVIVADSPSAQPELPEWAQKVEEYRKSAPSFVRNQLVWALYQTWKEYDGRLVHQRGKENR